MTPERIIKNLGKAKKLSQATGIPEGTIRAWACGYRKTLAPASFILRVLLAAQKMGILDRLLIEAKKQTIENHTEE